MKNLLAFLILAGITASGFTQEMASPPATATEAVDGTTVTIKYHQPGVKGRQIWGELVPFGKVWRTGANNATTLEVSDDVTIAGNALPAGRYALFTIPEKDKWTVIINDEPDQWGAYNYNSEKDVFRFEATPYRLDEPVERMTFDVDPDGTVSLTWDQMGVNFVIE